MDKLFLKSNSRFLLLLSWIICKLHSSNARIPPYSTWITNERKLYHSLLDKYDKSVRPVEHEDDSLAVMFGLNLNHIHDLNEEHQVLHTNAWLRYMWRDIQLKWEPSEFGDVKSIGIEIDKLWTPDIVLYNNYRDTYDVAYRSLAIVSNTGDLLWVPPVHLSTSCAVDLTKFPYDTQTCHMKFGSWTYHEKQINLTWFANDNLVDMTAYTEHQEFSLVEAKGQRNVKIYACCKERYIDLEYVLKLERKASYATHMIIAPSVILGLILPAMFILPPESKEKINFGIGLLLGNALILMVITSIIPTAHPNIPAIGLYHMTNMILIGFSLAISTLVMNMWAKGDRGKKLPGFIRQIALGVFGKLLCVSRDDFMPLNTSEPSANMRSLEIISDEPDSAVVQEDDRQNIFKNFAYNTHRAEWHQLAVIVDRLTFIVYIFLVIVTSLALATR